MPSASKNDRGPNRFPPADPGRPPSLAVSTNRPGPRLKNEVIASKIAMVAISATTRPTAPSANRALGRIRWVTMTTKVTATPIPTNHSSAGTENAARPANTMPTSGSAHGRHRERSRATSRRTRVNVRTSDAITVSLNEAWMKKAALR